MLSQTYVAKVKKIKELYPDARFIAITRKSPRFKYDTWEKALAPSLELLKDYKSNNDWEAYVPRFMKEMDNPESKEAMRKIIKEAQTKDIFLVCFEKEYPCHRFLILDMMKDIAKQEGLNVEIKV